MNIKSLLLGSAAALVAVSGARAADAVVIPEPEAVEYVRVCDAAGAGYLYIPGSETCLKIGGYVQYEISTGSGEIDIWTDEGPDGIFGSDDDVFETVEKSDGWNKNTEGRLTIDTYTDSDYGAVLTSFRLTTDLNFATVDENGEISRAGLFVVDRANLTVAGLNMGLNASIFDFSATGAADAEVGNRYGAFQVSYTASFGANSFEIQLIDDPVYNYVPDVVVKASAEMGGMGLTGAIVYSDVTEGFGAKATATYGDFGAVIQYSDVELMGSEYEGSNQIVIGANYGVDLTEKLNVNLGGAYGFEDDDYGDANWTIGAEAAYAATDTFTISARARAMNDDDWDARMRFKVEY